MWNGHHKNFMAFWSIARLTSPPQLHCSTGQDSACVPIAGTWSLSHVSLLLSLCCQPTRDKTPSLAGILCNTSSGYADTTLLLFVIPFPRLETNGEWVKTNQYQTSISINLLWSWVHSFFQHSITFLPYGSQVSIWRWRNVGICGAFKL